MIQRTTLDLVKHQLAENPSWLVLDIGCRQGGWPEADVYLDLVDFSKGYPGKYFVQGDACSMPFGDKSFDFIIASHILEHIADPAYFIKEMVRVGRAGYIEVPTALADNLYSGNPEEHLWWVGFCDVEQKITFQPPLTVLPELLRASDHRYLNKYFRQSFVTELLWHNDIGFLPPQESRQRILSSPQSRLLVRMRWLVKFPLFLIRKINRVLHGKRGPSDE
ncbi:MAG: class I SAM-dependent methyltransferase [Desulforhopalus sp.]